MKIISVVGARPNFMKIAPFIKAVNKYNEEIKKHWAASSSTKLRRSMGERYKEKIEHILVHTGQHYDDRMSQSFFKQLEIPQADINLGIGSGSHAEQVGKTMIGFEKILKKEKPDWVVVVGDVNAILSCSVTAKKENIKCCHIEAGLRSGDMSMPEEINRLIADRICDLLLTSDVISSENLRKEGVSEARIKFVGNIMIDTLEANRRKASLLNISEIINHNYIVTQPGILTTQRSPFAYHLPTDSFAVLTLHRPSNVDRKEVLEPIVNFLINEVCSDRLLIWTLHPRTRKMLETFDLFEKVCNQTNLILLEPLSYLDMLRLNMGADVMLTDSGGLQEECTVLGTPCLTLRWNTERPITLTEHGGASVLVGNNVDRIRLEYLNTMNKPHFPFRPPLWDGHTAERCLDAILNFQD